VARSARGPGSARVRLTGETAQPGEEAFLELAVVIVALDRFRPALAKNSPMLANSRSPAISLASVNELSVALELGFRKNWSPVVSCVKAALAAA